MLHELFDLRILQCAIPHLTDQFSYDRSGLLGKPIPPLGLLLVELMELLPEDPLGQIRFDPGDPVSGEVAGPAVRAVADHVDVGVVRLVMERRVPAELLPGDLHGFCHLYGIAGEEFLPPLRVIVAQPCGVLPAQRDDGEPHVARVAGHLVRNSGQHQWIIRSGEEGVAPGTLRAWPAGDVADVVVPLGNLVVVVLQRTGDELGGIGAGRSSLVVLVLEHSPAEREIPKELIYHLLLFSGRRELLVCRCDPLGALSGRHVADVVVQMGGGALRAALEIGALEYDAGHGASPPFPQLTVGSLIPVRISGSSEQPYPRRTLSNDSPGSYFSSLIQRRHTASSGFSSRRSGSNSSAEYELRLPISWL